MPLEIIGAFPMYWFFSPPGWGLMLWCLSLLLILLGGWLIATHVCSLESGERVLAGFGIGLVVYIWIVNWLGRVASPFWAFFGGALIVLALGVLSAIPFKGRLLDLNDLRIGPWILAGLALFWVFFRISKGTGLFDETSNLAAISTIANGQIPVRAYFGEASLHRYHYAIHFIGAAMMQLGRFTPWSAFDLSKSLVWSLSLLLTGLVGKRYLRIPYGSVLLAGVWCLAGGSRWLMLLLPARLIAILEQHVHLTGIASGGLGAALSSTLPMELSPPSATRSRSSAASTSPSSWPTAASRPSNPCCSCWLSSSWTGPHGASQWRCTRSCSRSGRSHLRHPSFS